MSRIQITYEHPPGSGDDGMTREFDPDYCLQSTRGKIRADQVAAGDYLKTTPRIYTKVNAVATVGE